MSPYFSLGLAFPVLKSTVLLKVPEGSIFSLIDWRHWSTAMGLFKHTNAAYELTGWTENKYCATPFHVIVKIRGHMCFSDIWHLVWNLRKLKTAGLNYFFNAIISRSQVDYLVFSRSQYNYVELQSEFIWSLQDHCHNCQGGFSPN